MISFSILMHYSKRFTVVSELHLDTKPRPKVPDLAIYSYRKFDADRNETRMTEPPLCAIEILSQEQGMATVLSKRFVYFDFGVKSYWLVLPATQTIYVYSSATEFEVFSKNQTLRDERLDIEIKLAEVF